ncbi:MAG: hypothetical protein ACREIY_04145 [Candidatus Rokuibacteriota bacterium]
MLDIVVKNGQVVTPEGVGAWDIGIQGARIAAVALTGTLPTDGAKVIDATGKIVVPGGIDPHTYLAHPVMSHPEEPGMTLGPEDDTPGSTSAGSASSWRRWRRTAASWSCTARTRTSSVRPRSSTRRGRSARVRA